MSVGTPLEPELIFYLGSRAGTAVALAVFGSACGAIGYVVSRLWQQAGRSARTAWTAGGAVFATLLAVIYISSLGGFYEVRGSATHLELRSLVPWWSSRMAWIDLERVDVAIAFRNRWRLALVERSGARMLSATSNRQNAEAAARAIRQRLQGER